MSRPVGYACYMWVRTKPEKRAEFLRLMNGLRGNVHAHEATTLFFEVLQGSHPDEFVFFEGFVDEAAQQAHANAPYHVAISPAGWAWLEANPARIDIEAASGWVHLNRRGRPDAFIGNLVQRFWLDAQRFHGATGFSVIVPHSARGASRELIRAVLSQPNLFAAYTFNANPKSAPLYGRHGMEAWPSRTQSTLKPSWRRPARRPSPSRASSSTSRMRMRLRCSFRGAVACGR